MSSRRRRRQLLAFGLMLFAGFIVAAGGAAPRYNRIVYGALPLALTLVCLGGAAYLRDSDVGRRGWLGLGICCWLLAAGVLVVWFQPSLAGALRPQPPVERAHVLLTLETDRIRTALFAELQPVELSNCRLERFGEKHDGGYLMCGNLLESAKAGYSYGIHGYDGWGCDVARKVNVPVHQYDCFDLTRPACSGGKTIFHAECIGPERRTDAQGRIFDTLENQFRTNGDGASRTVLKMDIEGAEWDTLLRAPSDLLARIDQFAVELHGVGLDHQLAVVRRLKGFFHVANVHFNNYACQERLDPFPASVYEVLYVNKRVSKALRPRPTGPHPLDSPNHPKRPDCQLAVSRWDSALPGALRFGFSR